MPASPLCLSIPLCGFLFSSASLPLLLSGRFKLSTSSCSSPASLLLPDLDFKHEISAQLQSGGGVEIRGGGRGENHMIKTDFLSLKVCIMRGQTQPISSGH